MKNIPDKQLKILFQHVTTFYKGRYYPKRVWIDVEKDLTKEQKLEIVNVISQYYNGWYKFYGQINGTEFYVEFYTEEHCKMAIDDLIQQQKKYMESDAYEEVGNTPSDSVDYSGAEGAEPEDEGDTAEETSQPNNRKTVIVIAAVAFVAIALAVVLLKKD